MTADPDQELDLETSSDEVGTALSMLIRESTEAAQQAQAQAEAEAQAQAVEAYDESDLNYDEPEFDTLGTESMNYGTSAGEEVEQIDETPAGYPPAEGMYISNSIAALMAPEPVAQAPAAPQVAPTLAPAPVASNPAPAPVPTPTPTPAVQPAPSPVLAQAAPSPSLATAPALAPTPSPAAAPKPAAASAPTPAPTTPTATPTPVAATAPMPAPTPAAASVPAPAPALNPTPAAAPAPVADLAAVSVSTPVAATPTVTPAPTSTPARNMQTLEHMQATSQANHLYKASEFIRNWVLANPDDDQVLQAGFNWVQKHEGSDHIGPAIKGLLEVGYNQPVFTLITVRWLTDYSEHNLAPQIVQLLSL